MTVGGDTIHHEKYARDMRFVVFIRVTFWLILSTYFIKLNIAHHNNVVCMFCGLYCISPTPGHGPIESVVSHRTEKSFDASQWVTIKGIPSMWPELKLINAFPCASQLDDVIKWKHFPRYWPFVRGIRRSPVNSPLKGQWRGAVIFLWSATE